jgi:hypothetical protein
MTFIKGLFNKKKEVDPKAEPAERAKPTEETRLSKQAEQAARAEQAKQAKLAKQEEQARQREEKRAAAYQPKEDANSFFLDTDSAKTFGDIDYMRTAKSIRKTFPKGTELIESTSSVSKVEGSAESLARAAQTENSDFKPSQEGSDRRRQDTSRDMFRNMAKSIKK